MMGSLVDDATKGIIPRLCDTLFDMIAEVCEGGVSEMLVSSVMAPVLGLVWSLPVLVCSLAPGELVLAWCGGGSGWHSQQLSY